MNGRGEVSSISLEQFFLLHQSGKALIFDARPAFFYNLGHIPGAINLPKNNCDEQIASTRSRRSKPPSPQEKPSSSIAPASPARTPGPSPCTSPASAIPPAIFSGGWDAWKDAGMPVE